VKRAKYSKPADRRLLAKAAREERDGAPIENPTNLRRRSRQTRHQAPGGPRDRGRRARPATSNDTQRIVLKAAQTGIDTARLVLADLLSLSIDSEDELAPTLASALMTKLADIECNVQHAIRCAEASRLPPLLSERIDRTGSRKLRNGLADGRC
jgi:hypothetical protein